jgi:hypothetical protein
MTRVRDVVSDGATLSGLWGAGAGLPRVATEGGGPSQPWAELCNPVGVEDGRVIFSGGFIVMVRMGLMRPMRTPAVAVGDWPKGQQIGTP